MRHEADQVHAEAIASTLGPDENKVSLDVLGEGRHTIRRMRSVCQKHGIDQY